MPAAGGNGIAMRAGLFLEGLSRSFRVRCLVIPVFGGADPPDSLVSRLAASVSVLPLERSPDDVADLRARLIDPVSRDRAAALHPRPALCRSATIAAAAAVADAAHDVALVHVYRLYLAPFLDVLLERPSRPVLTVDVDDIEDRLWREMGDVAQAAAYERLARHYLPAVDHVVTTSTADAATLASRYGRTKVTAIPNAVRIPPIANSTRSGPRAHDLVFVATLSYRPNADAARWLCEHVLPLLPGASVALVGSNPPDPVVALGRHPGVTVAASVPDVAPWYEDSAICVVPLRIGGGTRTKVLEGLAHQRPVVATSVGAEGLPLVAGRDGVLIADEPVEFARACRQLLDDPQLASRLAAAGHEAVATRSSVDVVGPQIAGLFGSLVADRTRTAVLASQLHRNRLAADLCDRLGAAGVRAILLKGASFGVWLYNSPLDRPSGDIDLLIDPADEPATGRVLAGLGFVNVFGRSKATLLGRPAVAWKRGNDYVDVHRGWFWGIGVPAEQSWAILSSRTEQLQIGGNQVIALDPAARALHVALHAVASGPAAHQQQEDLRRAIEHVPHPVWSEAAQLAGALEAQPAFAAALTLTPEGRVLGQRLQIGAKRSLETALRVGGLPPLASGIARLPAITGTRSKLAAVARAVVPTPSYLATRIPFADRSPFHAALAYPVWFAILARRVGPALVAVRRASRAAAARTSDTS